MILKWGGTWDTGARTEPRKSRKGGEKGLELHKNQPTAAAQFSLKKKMNERKKREIYSPHLSKSVFAWCCKAEFECYKLLARLGEED